uniref:Uncharacterized protein n=1 Tax=Aegilops tauschii subsp. strangulata TaxID=200361 RepID=A0A453RJ69_AEGTS
GPDDNFHIQNKGKRNQASFPFQSCSHRPPPQITFFFPGHHRRSALPFSSSSPHCQAPTHNYTNTADIGNHRLLLRDTAAIPPPVAAHHLLRAPLRQ